MECLTKSKLQLLPAAPRATPTPLSCSPNFPRASKWSGANKKIGERSETSVALERDKCGGASRLCFDAAHPLTCNLGWNDLQHTRIAVAFARWNFFYHFPA